MDLGSIVNNALGGLIGGLALLLLVGVGKHIYRTTNQNTAKAAEGLDSTLRSSEEYRQILQARQSYRMIAYMCLIMLLALLATIIAIWVQTRKMNLGIEWIGFILLLLCEIPLALYVGYSPITLKEVERKRQQNREKTFKEAHGARPYGYIFRYIVFPVIIGVYGLACFVGLALFLIFPAPFHIPIQWIMVGIGVILLVMIFFTYLWTKMVYRSVKDLKNVPYYQQRQLRQQFLQDEFEQ